LIGYFCGKNSRILGDSSKIPYLMTVSDGGKLQNNDFWWAEPPVSYGPPFFAVFAFFKEASHFAPKNEAEWNFKGGRPDRFDKNLVEPLNL
jgi:hypothetical protein